ncbi:Cysteine synthase 2 [Lithohypha guttulata]|uniref:Cysteine synthase 2 n=1 Tax=Lithohypha guttulata TaxID=1690604 RepID=UPI002DDF3818|nr:Cysteine synthase 2 [Lithohypha guttulata]KAK5106204.1 Cysteine synthase 2 [Lithohypha guttulata]
MSYESRHVAAAFLAGTTVTYLAFAAWQYLASQPDQTQTARRRRTKLGLAKSSPVSNKSPGHDDPNSPFISQSGVGVGIESTISNTPLVLIKSLSEHTGCTILGKCEFLNGAGNSPKDRVALSIINKAEAEGLLTPHSGDTIYEGTVGSTGISLATLARARGYKAHILMPSDQATEKSDLLVKLGAIVERVTPAPIVDQMHFVNRARNLAKDHTANPQKPGRGLFADQFETDANWRAHYEGTAPEIHEQTDGKIDAFVAGAGTGGTISGCAKYFKEKLGANVQVVLADPQGSGLYNKVKHGVMFHGLEREGTRRRQQVDTVVEGIGLTRSTRNFEIGSDHIDDAIKITDGQARRMARWLCEKDGIFVGSSSSVNCYAAVKTALQLGPGHTVVTILCDSGMRHLSKFWKQVGDVGGEEDMTFEDLMK